MINKNNKRNNILVMLSFSLLFVFIFAGCVRSATNELAIIPSGVLDEDVLNYSIPIIGMSNEAEGNAAKSELSVRETIIDSLDLNFSDPISVLSRELGYSPDDNLNTPESSSFNTFKLSNSDIVSINAANTSTPNLNINIDDPNLKQAVNSGKPRVLIYHSHTCESYAPGPADTTDQSVNVCAVGDELENDLQQTYNIETLHDKTIHDIYGYINSYDLSGQTLDKYLKKYGDFDLIIDMHRDSITNKGAVTRTINAQNTAVFRFVMARKNPHFDKNIQDVNSLINISNKLFPGLCTGIYYYNYGMGFFNQQKSNNAMLIEVGSNVNTTAEAKATAKCLARIIAEYFKQKS